QEEREERDKTAGRQRPARNDDRDDPAGKDAALVGTSKSPAGEQELEQHRRPGQVRQHIQETAIDARIRAADGRVQHEKVWERREVEDQHADEEPEPTAQRGEHVAGELQPAVTEQADDSEDDQERTLDPGLALNPQIAGLDIEHAGMSVEEGPAPPDQ